MKILMSYIVPLVAAVPLFSAVVVFLLPKNTNSDTFWSVGLWGSAFCFILSLFMWINFDFSVGDYQFL
jgi:NADH:ubiquinone oxidoreductase subunit 4 (subunit M)